jgi:hypothetical protein
MSHYNVESPEVQHAYIAIAEFFDAYSLSAARYYTQRVITAAGSYHSWKGDPSDVLFFIEKMEALVSAALTLRSEEAERQAALVTLAAGEAPLLTAYTQYCGRHYKSDPWYFFPRSLTRKEWANPYRVFAKLAARGGRKKWRFRLRELQFFALSISSINESDEVDLNTLQLYLLLTKLIDAAHLIDVRAITEIGGERRLKWKDLQEKLASPEASDEANPGT